jgi:quinol monooxygenase YgiN
MLIVIGAATAAPGRRQDMVAAVAEMARATRPDDGCEHYGFYADVTDPDLILSVEFWRDRAALDAHMGHDHTQSFIRTVPALVAGEPVMHFYNAEPTQEPHS